MKIKHFEDLDCWRLGRELSKMIYEITKEGTFSRDYGLKDQIRRAAVSVMTNIAEGFERGSNKDFAKFLYIARSSAGEVRSLLYVAFDQNYITEEEFLQKRVLCLRCSKVIYGLVKHLIKHSDWKTGLKILIIGWIISIFGISSQSSFL